MTRWRSLLAKQRLLLQQSRGYKEVTVLAGDPSASTQLRPKDPAFLRFATPQPQPYNHTQILGLIPETRVCGVWLAENSIASGINSIWIPQYILSCSVGQCSWPRIAGGKALDKHTVMSEYRCTRRSIQTQIVELPTVSFGCIDMEPQTACPSQLLRVAAHSHRCLFNLSFLRCT